MLPRGVYIHIPYCLSKCAYCDFTSEPLKSRTDLEHYLAALEAEIRLRASGRAETVYFGGGTPSLCAPGQIRRLLAVLAERLELAPGAEITLEANPATADRDSLAGFRRAGVNRLSVGVQSASDACLAQLGRAHSAAQAERLVREARAAGFENLSCDVIYGLPGQTVPQFRQDLESVTAWKPDHISLYALTLETGTPLAARVAAGQEPLPDEDAAADMYEWSREYLLKNGFLQYELSNFSKPGKACRHNLLYWTDGEYLGLGTAAHSYENGVRSWNGSNLREYLQILEQGENPEKGREKLKLTKKIAEELIMGLRLTEGVSKAKFTSRYGHRWQLAFQEAIQNMVQSGLLQEEEQNLHLTPRGMLLSNVVFRALV